MGNKRNDEVMHRDGVLIAGFLGAVLLTIPIVIRLAYGNGTGWDWVFLLLGVGLAVYWVLLALRGRRVRRNERAGNADRQEGPVDSAPGATRKIPWYQGFIPWA